MTKNQFWNQLLIFVGALLLIIAIREYFSHYLLKNGIEAYQTHTFLKIGANIILIVVSYYFIKKNGLIKIAGIRGTQLKKWYLLIFPLIYLPLLNAVFSDAPNMELLIPNLGLLIVYSLSIGFAEELSIRGFFQSHLINYFGNTKKKIIICVFATALFFGLMHLMKFDKGIYGEISQVCFATFIGVMFGFLLIITKRIYPLIIIHAIIDFVSKLDSIGVPIKDEISQSTSLESAVLTSILVLPCLIYGIFMMKKFSLQQNR